MAKIAYFGNIEMLGKAFVDRDYSEIREYVKENKEKLGFYIEADGEVYGYEIRENIPLTKLYGFRVRIVDFAFSGVEKLYNAKEDEILDRLFSELAATIENEKAYYTFRVPTQVMDVLIKFNVYFNTSFMCGGTVTYLTVKNAGEGRAEKTDVFAADAAYIEEHGKELLDISAATFDVYQGQYHISPITSGKAGEIYKDWLERSFGAEDELLFVADYEGKPAGFCTLRETDTIVEAVLGGVSNKFRELGAYKNMIRTVVNYATDKNKIFVIGTQFENLIVQGTWTQFGLKPFNSFYNFHLDAR